MKPSTALFRDEAVQEEHSRMLGRVVIPAPRLLFLGSVAATFVIVGLVLILAFGEYAPRHAVFGFLMPQRGLAKVFGARAGKVEMVQVRDGEEVEAGQSLALVSAEEGLMDGEGESAVTRVLSELSEQERRLWENLGADGSTHQSNKSRLQYKIRSLSQELKSAEAEKAALEQERRSAEAVQARVQELYEAGYVTEVEIAVRRQQLLGLERQSHGLAKAIAAVGNQLREAQLELEQQPLQAKRSRISLLNQISEIKRQIAGYEIQRGYSITAPISGRVTALQIEPGKPLTLEQPALAIIAMDAVLEAHLLVPSRAIGFVRTGQEVRLRYAAFPYQHYGIYTARVKEISRTTLRPEELSVDLVITEPMFRVKATLDAQTVRARGKMHALQSGMLVEADILLEERPLWAWFVEPLLAFRGRV